MRVFFHFAVVGFSNTYLVGPDGPGDAIIIDPGVMDVNLLKAIEENEYYVRSILITHGHESHIRGIRTLLKVYEAKIYAATNQLLDIPCVTIAGGSSFELSGLHIEAIEVPGHSNDSIVYRIGNSIFTGDTLFAGGIGTTPNAYAKALLVDSIETKILSITDDVILLPGHGPPSTIEAERRFNHALRDGI